MRTNSIRTKSGRILHRLPHKLAFRLSTIRGVNFELLAKAHEVIEGIPDDRIALSSWINDRSKQSLAEPSCGTIACLGGWLALHPDFKALGLRHDAGWGLVLRAPGTDTYRDYAAVGKLFNSTDIMGRMLAAFTDGGDLDDHIRDYHTPKDKDLSDKDLALWRIRYLYHFLHGSPA